MPTVEKYIDVRCSATAAYRRWTSYEAYPRFLAGVESVERVAERELRLRATFGATPSEWLASVLEEPSERRVTWWTRAPRCACTVACRALPGERTRVMLQIDCEPAAIDAPREQAVARLQALVRASLERFKRYAEGSSGRCNGPTPP